MAKWHTNLKRQKHFDKNNLSHNRVHFSLKILQKTSDFHIFMEACWTLDCRKGPETKIFHPGLVNLPSNFRKMAAFNWLPDFKFNAPSSFIYDLYGFIPSAAILNQRFIPSTTILNSRFILSSTFYPLIRHPQIRPSASASAFYPYPTGIGNLKRCYETGDDVCTTCYGNYTLISG